MIGTRVKGVHSSSKRSWASWKEGCFEGAVRSRHNTLLFLNFELLFCSSGN